MGPDERVLDAALRVRPGAAVRLQGRGLLDLPGPAGPGEVRMARNYALEPAEVAAGYVLTCQSSPVSEQLVVDYDG